MKLNSKTLNEVFLSSSHLPIKSRPDTLRGLDPAA